MRLLLADLVHQFPRNVSRADAVLEAIVYRCREHVVYAAELLQIPEPLELLCIYDVPVKLVESDVPVNGIHVLFRLDITVNDQRIGRLTRHPHLNRGTSIEDLLSVTLLTS